MQRSNARLRSSDGSGLLNELSLTNFRIIAHPTSNQLKACSSVCSEFNKCEQSSLSNFDFSSGNLAASR